jgi:D-sedoheptulose 7-phosphate isomerase
MLKEYLQELGAILQTLQITDRTGAALAAEASLAAMAACLRDVREQDGVVYLIGNGGSNAIASHTAVDLVNTCRMKAFALTDASQLTCMANDHGYPEVFKAPLENLFRPGDALIAISSSGASPNIMGAARLCAEQKGRVLTFSGFKPGNPLRGIGEYNVWLNSGSYSYVEVGHALLLHVLTDMLGNPNNKAKGKK